MVSEATGPATAVALNVAGSPATKTPDSEAVALREFAPTSVPSVQPPGVATPSVPVGCVAPLTDPPPLATVKEMGSPDTPLPNWSVTLTAGLVPSATPAADVWPSPPALIMFAAGPARPVAVNVTAVAPGAAAVTVFAPATVPSVHAPARAIPLASVVAVAPEIEPPPVATANV